jgi:hypothetical protein
LPRFDGSLNGTLNSLAVCAMTEIAIKDSPTVMDKNAYIGMLFFIGFLVI